MIDLHQRLSELDRLEAPDLRADIERRLGTQGTTTREPLVAARPDSPRWRGPLTAVATAAAILVVVAIATVVLRSEPTSGIAPAATITPTETPVATTVSAPDPWDGVIEVTFDGRECVVTGPTSVPAGVGQPFVLTNTSGLLVELEVGNLRGVSFSELAEMQRAADGFVYDDGNRVWEWLWPEALSFDPDARPAIDLEDNQRLDAFSLTFGTDVIYLVTNAVPTLTQPGSATDGDLVTPDGYWFCGEIDVTAIEF